ncbi:response regulator transcription factor [Pedobacter sp. MR2016-24]|uniref:response regulator transcription factor n=1 Tax=Pedobacter sp. MR2016-24 TaxID=2994466 RepID=UPI002246C0BA|nr:response regulator transcription factor [Pedobacter sp. MR2016-24]MCX2483177.1 response regulator transcription factor [Pedobacter sp. MR2016-24]
MQYKLLLVEDDEDLAVHLSKYLQIRGFFTGLAGDGQRARQCLAEGPYDLVLVDIMMPGEDGFSLAAHLKKSYPQLPFLFLSARNQKEDILKGLGLGADDYMIKPFDAEELVLRIHNILRRSIGVIAEMERYDLGTYQFRFNDLMLIGTSGEKVLTEKEGKLLKMLCLRKNHLLNRAEVLHELWGEPDFFNGRSLDVFISRLRKYLSDDPGIRIESIRGVGFRLREV